MRAPTVCALLALLTASTNALPEVKIGRTTVSGRSISKTVEFFGGIPYAEPPLGTLRLRDPILKTQLNITTFDARDYGKSCIQPFADPSTWSEDCLTISIHRPAGPRPSTQKLPVLFWTYGGAFVVGSSSAYNGSAIVEYSIKRGTPIIYVNFNYRLGPLGFPQGREADAKRALNLGVKDQIAALEWVQANIGLFGGDKDKVTIFGESAGAMLTGVLFLNPLLLPNLARAAIFESGLSNGPTTYPAARNEQAWQNFVSRVPSCASISTTGNVFACLKNATTGAIAAAVLGDLSYTELVWAPTLDPSPRAGTASGSLFPDYASRLYAQGRFARLPFIAGTNLDEGTSFSSQESLTEGAIKAVLVAQHSPPLLSQTRLEAAVNQLLAHYPDVPALGSPYGTGNELFGLPSSFKRLSSITGDITFDAPRRLWSQAASQFGVTSYVYQFTEPQPVPHLGVSHAAEIPYVYGPGQTPVGVDGGSQDLSTVIMDYWISFAVSLNPNDGRGSNRPRWPQYTTTNQVLLRLETGNTNVFRDDYRKAQIDFINKNTDAFLR